MNKCKRNKTKTISKTQHKNESQMNQKKQSNNKNKQTKKRSAKRERKIENYIEQRFRIQKQQHPFYRILELALLNKEKILHEKQHQIKQHKHKETRAHYTTNR